MRFKLSHTFFLITIGLILINCSATDPAVIHGTTLADYEEILLPAKYGRGAERLKIESDYDVTIEKFLYVNGAPDYIYVEGLRVVRIFYFSTNEMLTFKRPILSPYSKVYVEKCIPDKYISRIMLTQSRRGVQNFSLPKHIGC